MSNKGFTLVELLVVISIIAILSVIGITVFSGVQKNARDVKRRGDIDAIAKALESKRSPGSVSYTAIKNTDMAGGKIPEDPRATGPYYVVRFYVTYNGAISEPDPTITGWAPNAQGPTPLGQSDANASGFWIANATASNGFDDFSLGGARFNDVVVKSWKLCARLEAGTAGTVYCKSSSQ